MKKYDICGIGELLIDFTSSAPDEYGKPRYAANPGGAHPNVLAAASQLGLSTAMLSCVGSDALGQYLIDSLEKMGIATPGVVRKAGSGTTLAFVHNSADGDRSFSFYWNSCANAEYTPDDVRYDMIRDSRIMQLGSVIMSTDNGLEATMKALEEAKGNGVIISFDPNLRPNLWNDVSQMVPRVRKVMPYAAILKVSEEEAELLTGHHDIEKAADALLAEYANIKLLFITLGADGCYITNRKHSCRVASVKVKAIDTTGCGDAFTGGALTTLLKYGCAPEDLTAEQLEMMGRIGCSIGAYVATKYGGVLSMPTAQQLNEFLQQNGRKPLV